jgi:hypothetical protein
VLVSLRILVIGPDGGGVKCAPGKNDLSQEQIPRRVQIVPSAPSRSTIEVRRRAILTSWRTSMCPLR